MESEEKKEPSRWSDMAQGIGWRFIWLGIGGCIAISNYHNDKPLIYIGLDPKRESQTK